MLCAALVRFPKVIASMPFNLLRICVDHVRFMRQFASFFTICDLVVSPICLRASRVFNDMGFCQML
jgi:hypothetical protein